MKKSKLLTMIATLSDKEFKEFGKYLEGTTYRKTSSIFLLYNYLKKVHPEYPEKKVLKAKVQKSIFKDAPNAERSLMDTMYKLTIILEDFFIKKTLEERNMDRNFLLLESLKKRKLDKMFFGKIEALEKNWEKEKEPGAKQWYDSYKLKEMYKSHPNNNKESSNDDFMILLDKFYLSMKLYWAFLFKGNSEGIVLNEENTFLIREIMELAKSPIFQEIPQIKIFHRINATWTEESMDTCLEIQKILFANLEVFNEMEKTDIITSLQMSYLKISREGSPQALEELFQFNCLLAKKKLLLEDGYISTVKYRFIINMSCLVKEFDWAKKFLLEYQKYLPEHLKEDIIALSNAAIAVHQDKYEDALEYLIKLKFTETLDFLLYTRGTMLQCYYELEGYDDLFDNLIKSFTIFLNRDTTIGEYTKTAIRNFIFYIKKLKKFKDNKTPVPTEFIQALSNESRIVAKVWLLRKVEELS